MVDNKNNLEAHQHLIEGLYALFKTHFNIDLSEFNIKIIYASVKSYMLEKGHNDLAVYIADISDNVSEIELLYQYILISLMPNNIIINQHYDIEHIHGNISLFSTLEAGALTRNIAQLIQPDLRDDIKVLTQKALQKKAISSRHNVDFYHKDHDCKVTIIACPFSRPDHNAAQILIAFRLEDSSFDTEQDITEQGLAAILQKDLAYIRSFHNLIFDTIPDYVLIKDGRSNIVEANAAFKSAYPDLSIIGNQGIEDHLESEAEEFLEQDKKAFETGYSEIYEKITFPDGITRTLHTKKIVFERDGQKYILCIARDMSDHLKTKQELKSLAYKNDAFVSSSGDGYWDWDLKTDYEYMSPRFWEIFGYKAEEKEHHPSAWKDMIFPEDLEVTQQNLEKHIQTKGEYPFEQEVRYQHKDGSTVTVLCKGKVVEWDADGNALRMIGAHTNITELKKVQQSLMAANEELSQFAYRTSHDLRAPLKSSLGIIDLIKIALGHNNLEKVKELVGVAETTLWKLDQLVSDILLMVRAEKEDKHKTQIDVDHIINDSVQMLETLQSDKNIEIIKDISIPHIWTYRFQFQSILENLLSNAFKYSDPLEPHSYVKISLYDDEDMVYLSVRDNGIGIDPKYHDKLFTLFSRFHKSTSCGSGIGLYMIKKIATALKGDLIYKHHAQGAEFIVSLPKE